MSFNQVISSHVTRDLKTFSTSNSDSKCVVTGLVWYLDRMTTQEEVKKVVVTGGPR